MDSDDSNQSNNPLLAEDEIKQEVDVDPKDSKSEVDTALDTKPVKKESKAGIIYLSTIPPGMNVKQIREYFEQFGEIHRSFIQPEKKKWKTKGKVRNQTFTEGWIEFRKRRKAKKVAQMLNNTPVGGKKTKKYHDFLWSIKYLPGFQWVHLNERLAYERISLKQRLRTEIAAAKREANFFARSVDKSKKLKRQKKDKELEGDDADEPMDLDSQTQAGADPESDEGKRLVKANESESMKSSTKNPKQKPKDRVAFFKSLFTR